MNVFGTQVTQSIADALAGLIVAAILALVSRMWILLGHYIGLIKNRTIREVLLDEVAAAEQKYGAFLKNPQEQAKVKQEVMVLAQARLPHAALPVIDSALESAVLTVKSYGSSLIASEVLGSVLPPSAVTPTSPTTVTAASLGGSLKAP